MNQLELTKRAKGYIDALANGTDPISGRELPEDTVLNHPRMIRCFFYVSDILRQVVENGGQVGVQKKVAKQPFFLSITQREDVPFSKEPLTITKFVDLLNGTADLTGMKKLRTRTVTDWLVSKGFLFAETNAGGQRSKRPSSQGVSIGIFAEEYQGTHGPYSINLYNESAQRFIVDNLDDILSAGS